MNDFVALANSTKFVDIPASKRTASERATLVQHRSDFLHPIGHYIVSFASICQHLIIKVPAQDINVPIVETYGVRRSTEF